ncbi:MAG: hypothetical protein ABEI86_06785 [Halobacteriaceae archaeon]|jgi:hypothetical protein
MADNQEPERIGLYVQSEDDTDAVYISIPHNQLQIWDEKADEMGVSRSEAIRAWTEIGRKMYDRYDPTLEERGTKDGVNPLKEVILDNVESGEENARTIDEIGQAVKNAVEERALELLYEDDAIANSGREFYKQ